MKTCYIFGYGSLISAESTNRSLQRSEFTVSDLIPCYLMDYERSWTYLHPVFSFEKETNVNGIFLNIQSKKGAITNGVIFQVNAKELERLKIREVFYDLVEVTDKILLPVSQISHFQENIPIFTFTSKTSNLIEGNEPDLYIFKSYEAIMKPACLEFGEDFWQFYLTHTAPDNLPRLGGNYTSKLAKW